MMMGDGPSLDHMQRLFWAFVGAAIGAAAAIHLYNLVLSRQRRIAVQSSQEKGYAASAPTNVVTSTIATWTAICRETSEALPPSQWTRHLPFTFPPLGRILIVSAELSVVLALCFYRLDVNNKRQWEDVAYRCGYIALAQLPLIFLLAGKNNLIGFLTGSSYERLNWLHRWAARTLFLTATLHLGFWLADWNRYDYIATKLRRSKIARHGLIAWSILLWINLSSVVSIRRWNYELFVIQHIASYAAFTAMVYIHVDGDLKNWVWVSIALLLFDRSIRLLRFAYINLSIFHHHKGTHGLWSCKASFEPLNQGMTRIKISDPPISWSVGQHVMLSCHSIAPFQAHPFTIASIPQDGEMTFLVKTKKGGTKRFSSHAERQQHLPFSTIDSQKRLFSVAIEGPYGRIRNLQQFDSVVLIAGASGGTFTVPLLRDIVASWSGQSGKSGSHWFNHQLGTVTRVLRFVWVIKSKDQFGWFSDQLDTVMQDVKALQAQGSELEVDMSIYVTCDESFVAEAGPCEEVEGKEAPIKHLRDPSGEKDVVAIEMTSSIPSTKSGSAYDLPPKTCGPEGTCCCKALIEDEDEISPSDRGSGCECTCGRSPSGTVSDSKPSSSNDTSSKSLMEESPEKHALKSLRRTVSHPSNPSHPYRNDDHHHHHAISIFTGRPNLRTVINKVLEQARGESAVVACGPRGLVADVRRSVVSLSDERAVHRGGTGAQGIYLHTEAFDY